MEQYQKEFLSGASALASGKYHEAINLLEKALTSARDAGLSKSDDTFENGYFNIGQAKKAIDDFEGAITYYSKAIDCNPSRFENAYLFIAECCFNIDSYSAMEYAIKYLNQCTRYFPKNESAFMNKGIAYLKINDSNNAKIAFLEARKLGNKDADNFIRDYC
jgi:tetratricopeptide (TPR) repeat protein